MKIRVCLVKCLSKIRVYSIIPTFSTSSDIHAYWVLIFHFYSQHGVFCSENKADLLWNYFSDSVFRASLKRPSRTSRSSASMSSFPRKMIAFYNQNNSHTDYVVISASFTYNMHVCHSLLLHMTGFHIQDAHSVFYRPYSRQITVVFTLQSVNLITRTVEQYNDTSREDMSCS